MSTRYESIFLETKATMDGPHLIICYSWDFHLFSYVVINAPPTHTHTHYVPLSDARSHAGLIMD